MEPVEEATSILSLPVEIVQQIFKHLPGYQLLRCREVCLHWKQIVDSDDIWRDICTREYRNAIEEATSKCNQNLSWFNLYKSLSLWPKVSSAEEKWREFAIQGNGKGTINAVHVRNGVVAVHRNNCIEYYDLETLEQIDSLAGNYKKYDENDHVLVLMHCLNKDVNADRDDHLRIVPKDKNHPNFENTVQIDNVTMFRIVDKDVYYLKSAEDASEIYVCKCSEGYKSRFISRINEDVWGFRETEEGFEVLTKHFGVYLLVGTEFVCTQYYNVRHETDYLFKLIRYNFFDELNCFRHYLRRCMAKSYNYNPSIDIFASVYSMTTIRVIYDKILLVGNKMGNLKMYLIDKGNFDVNHPTKKYGIYIFLPVNTLPVINGLDAAETENGHVIVVSTPNKVMALSLNHD